MSTTTTNTSFYNNPVFSSLQSRRSETSSSRTSTGEVLDSKCSDYFTFDGADFSNDFLGKGYMCSVFSCKLRPEMEDKHPFGPLPPYLCVKSYNSDMLRKHPDFISKVIDREYHALTNFQNHPNIVRMVATFKEKDPQANNPDEYCHVYVVQERAIGVKKDPSIIESFSPEDTQMMKEALKNGVGPDLHTYLYTHKTFGENIVRYIMAQLLSAVMCLHELEPPIIHRDIRPVNIGICGEKTLPNGRKVPIVKLLDFSLSRTVPIEEQRAIIDAESGAHFGWMTSLSHVTEYMAKEVFRKTSNNTAYYSEAFDIYATGIILFVLATKKFPSDQGANRSIQEKFSPAGLELYASLASEHSANRPSARAALCHRWFDPIREEYRDIFHDNTLVEVKEAKEQPLSESKQSNV